MERNLSDQIKRSVDLAAYVRSCGIELKKHGSRDLKGLCPFHDDHNPSMIISPHKGLFNCPVCRAGGSVIDFAMGFHKLDLKEVLEKLGGACGVRRSPQLAAKEERGACIPASGGAGKPCERGACTLPLERANQLVERTAEMYEKTFSDVPEGRKYLEGRGITDAGLFGHHRIGYCNGSLLKILPGNGNARDELKEVGVLLSNTEERFSGCVVFPVLDPDNNIVTLYGRYTGGGAKRHVFLPGRTTGLWNASALRTHTEIILVESVIDALSVEMCGLRNVVSIQGTNGLSESGIKLMKEHGVRKIILLLDGDKPGQDAAFDLMGRLSKDFSVASIPLPDDHDPNSYLVKYGSEKLSSLLAGRQTEEPAKKEKGACPPAEFTGNNGAGEKAGVCGKLPMVAGNSFSVTMGLRRYQIIGLEKKQRSLRATVRTEKGGRLHVDTVDFYSAKMRKQLCQDICAAFEELPETIDADISKLLQVCESRREEDAAKKENEGAGTPSIILDANEKAEAEAFGRSPGLVESLLSDFVKCGLVGEESNKLLCYLAMTSRKMEEPLSVLILSSSGAGKTALQDAALAFCPPEDLVKLTSLSARALFYKEKTSLKNKVLAIEEGAGAEDASYAIRNLISSDSLTSEVAIRDPQTGKLTTMTNIVEGPLAVFCTTTNPEVDPETRSRFLVTGIDESREQTRRILEFQRARHSVEGLKENLEIARVLALHRNFQRLLKPVKVVNPLVDKLGYSDDRLQGRRAQPQYLNLISTVAFLRQMQKEIRRLKRKNEKGMEEHVEFVEVDEKDIGLGNELALEILGKTLDELSIPARDLLEQLEKMIEGKVCGLRTSASTGHDSGGQDAAFSRKNITFTRREVREFTGWTRTRTQIHLKELIDMEYVILDSGRSNGLQFYKLVYDGQGRDGRRFIPGVQAPFQMALLSQRPEEQES